jgi:hypothetical protein
MRRVEEHQHIIAGVSRRGIDNSAMDGCVLYRADVERSDPRTR